MMDPIMGKTPERVLRTCFVSVYQKTQEAILLAMNILHQAHLGNSPTDSCELFFLCPFSQHFRTVAKTVPAVLVTKTVLESSTMEIKFVRPLFIRNILNN